MKERWRREWTGIVIEEKSLFRRPTEPAKASLLVLRSHRPTLQRVGTCRIATGTRPDAQKDNQIQNSSLIAYLQVDLTKPTQPSRSVFLGWAASLVQVRTCRFYPWLSFT